MIVPSELQLRKEPKQARSRKLVQGILDAALEIADTQGLAAFNTNAVAEHAGIDVASIYQYFPNKESILFWAAERWLRRIRETCEELEQPEYAQLPWREFFARHGELITGIPEHRKAYSSLESLWALYPEYQRLSEEHGAYMVDFVVRHCQRFGATMDRASLQAMAGYLYLSSNAVIATASASDAGMSDSLLDWNYQVWIMLLERALPD